LKSKVVILECDSYNFDKVYEKLKIGFKLLGGIEEFVKPNENILLKPNVLAAALPEKAVTTHPVVFEAVAKILKESSVNLKYGDSPGFNKPNVALKKCGIYDIAKKLNIELADFESGKRIEYKEAKYKYWKDFDIANGVLEADGIVSISKMKAHQLTRITGSVKNQFGCLYGLNKAKMHVKIPSAVNFSKLLVDINMFLKPRLYIMDGIVAMEGNGPASGNPRNMNVLLISSDPVALDSTFCRIIDLEPSFVATNKFGKDFGLGTYLEDEIELLGDDIKKFIKKDFNVVRREVKDSALFGFLNPIRNFIVRYPAIDNKNCTKCGICVESCPVDGKAISFKNGDKKKLPIYNYNKCIRCYCCQEVCPNNAIYVKTPFLAKLFD